MENSFFLEMPHYRLESAQEIVEIFNKLPDCCADTSIKYIRISLQKIAAETLLKLFGFEKGNRDMEKEQPNLSDVKQDALAEKLLIKNGTILAGFNRKGDKFYVEDVSGHLRVFEIEDDVEFGQNTPMLSELQQKVVGILETFKTNSNNRNLSTTIYAYSPNKSDDDAIRYISELDGFEPAYIGKLGFLVTKGTFQAVDNALAQLGFSVEDKAKFVFVDCGTTKTGRWVLGESEPEIKSCVITKKIREVFPIGSESVPNDLNDLVENIVVWADDKGIFEKATPQTQLLKAMEEMGELAKYLLKDDQHEVMDAIGDIVVCLTNLAHMRGTTLNECVQQAYDVISKRKGKMVNGAFVKEEE